MRKILIGTTALLAVGAYATTSSADVSLSGFTQYLVGSSDQTTIAGQSGAAASTSDPAGIADGRFTRIYFNAETTTDNGLTVGTTQSLISDVVNNTTPDNTGGLPTKQNIYINTAMGTIDIGNTASATTTILARPTGSIPGADIDTGYAVVHFMSGDTANTFEGFNEYGYANNAAKLTWVSNSYDGLKMAVSYTPDTGETVAGDGNNASAQTVTNSVLQGFSDVIGIAAGYSGAFEGVDVNIGISWEGGNGATVSNVEYEDLNQVAIHGTVSMAGFTLGYMWHDRGDSGGIVTTNGDGGDANVVTAKYTTGAITVGGALANSIYTTAANADNDDEEVTYGIGYNLGGGVDTYVAYFSREQDAGVNSTTRTDASGIFAGINFSF